MASLLNEPPAQDGAASKDDPALEEKEDASDSNDLEAEGKIDRKQQKPME